MNINNKLEVTRNYFSNLLEDYKIKERDLENKILKKQEQIIRLKTRLQNLSYPIWTEILLRPVIDEIKKQLPGWVCDDVELIPLGLGCHVSVFFIKEGLDETNDKWKEENSLYITFRPGDLRIGELLLVTQGTDNIYEKGTIGELNGFNQVTKPLESIEEAVSFLKNQIKNEVQ